MGSAIVSALNHGGIEAKRSMNVGRRWQRKKVAEKKGRDSGF
jgi:hypothetical protein